MFGIEWWLLLAVVSSVAVVVFACLRPTGRGWVYRLMLAMGFLCLIWGLMPMFGGGGMNQYLVVGAIIAFGFLVLSDSTGDGSRW